MLSHSGGKLDDFNVSSIKDVEYYIFEKTAIREREEETGILVKNDLKLINNHVFKRLD